jgi:hypothetical protein
MTYYVYRIISSSGGGPYRLPTTRKSQILAVLLQQAGLLAWNSAGKGLKTPSC